MHLDDRCQRLFPAEEMFAFQHVFHLIVEFIVHAFAEELLERPSIVAQVATHRYQLMQTPSDLIGQPFERRIRRKTDLCQFTFERTKFSQEC